MLVRNNPLKILVLWGPVRRGAFGASPRPLLLHWFSQLTGRVYVFTGSLTRQKYVSFGIKWDLISSSWPFVKGQAKIRTAHLQIMSLSWPLTSTSHDGRYNRQHSADERIAVPCAFPWVFHIFSTAMVPVVNKTTEGSSNLATAVRLEM
jgi:hypothetical protein